MMNIIHEDVMKHVRYLEVFGRIAYMIHDETLKEDILMNYYVIRITICE